MRYRFILTVVTFLLIIVAAGIAIFFAKGYRFSTKTGNITGTGILSINSIPDQASVYIDGHLTTATNTNINSLTPKVYDVRIHKDGYIDWEKKVEVKEGFVTQIKATLFRTIPTIYPVTYTGAENPLLSPDGLKLAYVVPLQDNPNPIEARKSGLWVWPMGERSLAFTKAGDPIQVAISTADTDYSKAKLSWSPDSSQILATFPDKELLIDASRLNDPPRDITAVLDPTIRTWQADQQTRDETRLQTIKDLKLRQIASSAAILQWSPDETKILYCSNDCTQKTQVKQEYEPLKQNYKVADILTGKIYDLPQANSYTWFSDSEHIILTELSAEASPTPMASSQTPDDLVFGNIAIVEYDGQNKDEIFAGNFIPDDVFAWPDGSRLLIVSSIPTPTGSQPNLYGVNLK